MRGAWRPYSEETARLIDAEVRRVLDESYADALRLLCQQRQELDALLEHETLDEQEILHVTGLRPAARPGVLQLPVSVAAFGRNGSNSHNSHEGGS
jgi:cell division protease FtsH